jgi:dolichol-phosphate mannosyltransferase
MSHRPKLSAIIACYRDAPAIPEMHARLTATFQKIEVDYEIIFVNDRSPDNAAYVLAELASRDPAVMVINHTRNFGSQNAFTSGMRIATGEAVILLDGDLQDPPELIEAFYEKWQAGYEIVYGVRVKRRETLFLQVSYKLFYRLFRKLAYIQVPLDAGDFSLMDKRAVRALNSLPERDRFMRGMRAWVGFKQTGVDYIRPPNKFRPTTNNLVANLRWARKAIFSFSIAPLEYIITLSLMIVGLSFLGIIWQLGFRLLAPSATPSGLSTLIILILFLGGIQLLSVGVLGVYIGHIFEEVKGRPHYIIDNIINPPPHVNPDGTFKAASPAISNKEREP